MYPGVSLSRLMVEVVLFLSVTNDKTCAYLPLSLSLFLLQSSHQTQQLALFCKLLTGHVVFGHNPTCRRAPSHCQTRAMWLRVGGGMRLVRATSKVRVSPFSTYFYHNILWDF